MTPFAVVAALTALLLPASPAFSQADRPRLGHAETEAIAAQLPAPRMVEMVERAAGSLARVSVRPHLSVQTQARDPVGNGVKTGAVLGALGGFAAAVVALERCDEGYEAPSFTAPSPIRR